MLDSDPNPTEKKVFDKIILLNTFTSVNETNFLKLTLSNSSENPLHKLFLQLASIYPIVKRKGQNDSPTEGEKKRHF